MLLPAWQFGERGGFAPTGRPAHVQTLNSINPLHGDGRQEQSAARWRLIVYAGLLLCSLYGCCKATFAPFTAPALAHSKHVVQDVNSLQTWFRM